MNQIEITNIQPEKPQQNTYNERHFFTVRYDCLIDFFVNPVLIHNNINASED